MYLCIYLPIYVSIRLTNQVTFNEERIVLAKDALNKDVDYYDIYDPRNPLNERRRQEKPVAKKPNN